MQALDVVSRSNAERSRRLSEGQKSWASGTRKKRSCFRKSDQVSSQPSQEYFEARENEDFVEEVMAARTKKNPEFPKLVLAKQNGIRKEQQLIACAIELGYPRAIEIVKDQIRSLIAEFEYTLSLPIGEWKVELNKLVKKGLPVAMVDELMKTPLDQL